jgi:hypothetical protein
VASESPLEIRVYDKRLAWQGNVGQPIALSGSVLEAAPGSFQLTLGQSDPMVDDVLAKGARIGITYRDAPLFSGMRRGLSGSITASGHVQATFQGDRRMLTNTLAIVAHANPISPSSLDGSTPEGRAQAHLQANVPLGPVGTIQGQYGYTVWPVGEGQRPVPAETAVKWLVRVHLVERLGRPVRIAPDLGRGGVVPLPLLRNPSVAEGVQPILDAAGLILTAVQRPGDEFVTIDVKERDLWPAPLTSAAGVVDGGSWSLNPPSATRAFVGGPGQDAARAFFEVRDATGLEDDYGDVIEVFRDATGANLKWPDTLSDQYRIAKYFLQRPEIPDADKAAFRTYIAAAGDDALSDGAATTSVNAKLAETEQLYYGGADGVQLGDRITVETEGGVLLEDVVTEAEFSYTASKGVSVTPILGARKDDPNRMLGTAIVRLAAGQRRIQRER